MEQNGREGSFLGYRARNVGFSKGGGRGLGLGEQAYVVARVTKHDDAVN